MNTTQRNLIGLMALALIIAMTPVQQASAKVRVRATVATPYLSVQVNTARPVIRQVRNRPMHRPAVIHISKKDRRMAKRLARYTGYSKRELLDMRRSGYSWKRIGRYLDIRPQVVKAARNARSWERFLGYGNSCRVAHRGNPRHR